MSLPANQAVLPPPSQPSTLTYGQTANIDATNSYPNGYAIDLATTQNRSVPRHRAVRHSDHSGKFAASGLD